MRILLIGSQMATGGAQQVLLDQAGQFQAEGHAVTVVYFYDREGLEAAWKQRYNFPIFNLGAHRKGAGALRNGSALLRGWWRLWKIILAGRFDAAESFTQHANLLGLPVAALGGVKTRIASDHGIFYAFPGWQRRLHSALVNSPLVTTLVCISEAVASQARAAGCRARKIVVIPNGVRYVEPTPGARERIRAEAGMQAGQALILTVGRLTPEKDHATLLRAMVRVREELPGAVLAMVGDGPRRAETEALARDLGLVGGVRFAGFRKDVPDWLAACDLFVLSSESEGLGLVLIEAMAAGKPVIATRAGGIVEVLRDGENGLLVPVRDPAALARAMARMLRSPAEAQGMAAAARQDYQARYTLETMTAAYLKLFRR